MSVLSVTFTCPSCGHVEKIGAAAPPLAVPIPPMAPPNNAVPSCPQHGPMTHKAGTNKAGKAYSGFFCFAEGCETTPVWDPKR